MVNDYDPNEEDLHSGKDSHMSLPVAHDMEFHLRKEDVGHECEVGEKYVIVVPVEVVSKDEDMTRFKQMGPIKVGAVIKAEEMSKDELRDHLLKSQSESNEY
jgi:hypothetical protein